MKMSYVNKWQYDWHPTYSYQQRAYISEYRATYVRVQDPIAKPITITEEDARQFREGMKAIWDSICRGFKWVWTRIWWG